jgi:hypothetical protein
MAYCCPRHKEKNGLQSHLATTFSNLTGARQIIFPCDDAKPLPANPPGGRHTNLVQGTLKAGLLAAEAGGPKKCTLAVVLDHPNVTAPLRAPWPSLNVAS